MPCSGSFKGATKKCFKRKAPRVAIYTRTSSPKNNTSLTVSKKRQVDTCLRALEASLPIKVGAKDVLQVSEVKSGRLPLAKRPALMELISGSKGALKVFVESARAVARDVLFPAVPQCPSVLALMDLCRGRATNDMMQAFTHRAKARVAEDVWRASKVKGQVGASQAKCEQ